MMMAGFQIILPLSSNRFAKRGELVVFFLRQIKIRLVFVCFSKKARYAKQMCVCMACPIVMVSTSDILKNKTK